MDVSPKPGDTLFACHISQVHGQCVGWNLYSSVQTPRHPRSLNLTHSISLPERGNLPRDALENYSLNHTGKSTETEDTKESSSTLQHSEISSLTSPQRKTQPSHCRLTPRWQNLFIPETEMNEDVEDEDSDGDNLHKYREGSSLQLQGFNIAKSMNTPSSTKCRTEHSSFNQKILNYEINSKENKQQQKDSATGCEDCRDSKRTPISFMDCDEQDWVDEQDYSKNPVEEYENSWAQTDNLLNCESLSQNPTEYITDSSCNSSDGVLVNFSAIYNKTNNAVPATPLNLEGPDHQDGSNPEHSLSSRSVDPNRNIYPLDSDGFLSTEISDLAICLQSQAWLTGSTQNYYKLVTCDLSSQSSPNTPWSSFSETHSRDSSPPSQYFLIEQSEGEENERAKVNQNKHQGDGEIEKVNSRVTRDKFKETNKQIARVKSHLFATKISDHKSSRYINTPQSQSWIGSQKGSTLSKGVLQNSCPSHLDTNLSSPQSRQHATSFAEIARCKKEHEDSSVKQSTESPSGSYSPKIFSFQKENASDQNMSFNPQNNDKITVISLCNDSNNKFNPEGGECSLSQDVVQYTKAQRPTFLPIQPFVLQAPSRKQQSKAPGSLLNQYISHKYNKPGPSKATCKTKGNMQFSPVGYYSTIQMEAATSSDTCSTCTSSPVLPCSHPQGANCCSLLGRIYQNLDLMNRSPDETEDSPKACSSQQHPSTGKQKAYSLSFMSTNQHPNCLPEQVSLVQTQTPLVTREELSTISLQDESNLSQHRSSPATTPVTSIPLSYLPGNGQRSLWPFEVCTKERLGSNIFHYFGSMRPSCVKKQHQHSDSFSRMDRPTEEFWLFPEEPFSDEELHKRSMLKDLSLAVDLITVHFSSRQEAEKKIRLGNSSLCSSIRQHVLKHLCPAIQNILQDGLKAYKLDFIIGQRRNKLWNVIQATACPGSSTRMPDSLVSVIKKCSNLSNHSTRLCVFIMDLLNLRALEFWICHLYSCIDIVEDHYHQWGFLSLAQRPMYGPLFQELLLLLQPLSSLPFDLDLPSESHTQNKQQNQTAAESHRLLAQSSQILQMSSIQKNAKSHVSNNRVTSGYWLEQTPTSECESTLCYSNSTHKKEDKENRMENNEIPGPSHRSQDDKSLSTLRWARLFGSVGGTTVGPTKAQKNSSGNLRRPSEWLKIGATQVDLLAQSVLTRKMSEIIHINQERDKRIQSIY